MTQCTKQFDPLKKCRYRDWNEPIIKLEIFTSREKPIESHTDHRIALHDFCGHHFDNHLNSALDLINVEEEMEEFDKEDVDRKFAEINEALDFVKGCAQELQASLGLK